MASRNATGALGPSTFLVHPDTRVLVFAVALTIIFFAPLLELGEATFFTSSRFVIRLILEVVTIEGIAVFTHVAPATGSNFLLVDSTLVKIDVEHDVVFAGDRERMLDAIRLRSFPPSDKKGKLDIND